MGTFVDAEKVVAARQAGMSLTELHRRAHADEFSSSHPMNLKDSLLYGMQGISYTSNGMW
jgi:hypothetical protein